MNTTFKTLAAGLAVATGVTVAGVGVANAGVGVPYKYGSEVRATFADNTRLTAKGSIQRKYLTFYYDQVSRTLYAPGAFRVTLRKSCAGTGTRKYRGRQVLTNAYGAKWVTDSSVSEFRC